MDTLKNVEEYAALLLTIHEISILCNLDAEELRREIRGGKSEIALAYQRGKLQTIVDIRRQTVLYAKKGSPAAENLVHDYILKQKQHE